MFSSPTKRGPLAFEILLRALIVGAAALIQPTLAKLRSWDGPEVFITGAPNARYQHGFAALGGKIFLFGGAGIGGQLGSEGALNDLHRFDPARLAWADLSDDSEGTPPPARYSHGFAPAGGRLFVHAGQAFTGNFMEDLFAFDPTTLEWSNLTSVTTGPAPPPRMAHGFAEAGGMLYVFGGLGPDGHLSDLYRLDPGTLEWVDLGRAAAGGAAPSARYAPGFGSAGGRLFVFAGKGPQGFLSDLFQYDPGTLKWTELTNHVIGAPPAPRYNMGFAGIGGKLYIFGGASSTGEYYTGDMHVLDMSTVTWSPISPRTQGPPPVGRGGNGVTVVNGQLYFFGGQVTSGEFIGEIMRMDPAAPAWVMLTGELAAAPHLPRLRRRRRRPPHCLWRQGR